MKASLTNYRQSPRKVRLVANLMKGKTVPMALEQLRFLPKRASLPLAKLLKSAVANLPANQQGDEALAQLVVMVEVNAGPTLKRSRPRARGSASRINKRTSKVNLVLRPAAEKKSKIKSAKK